jgi:hypothetical protein
MAWCLNVLVWKMPKPCAAWLQTVGVMELNRACDLDLRWDGRVEQFVPAAFVAGGATPANVADAGKPRDEVASDGVTDAERNALMEDQ